MPTRQPLEVLYGVVSLGGKSTPLKHLPRGPVTAGIKSLFLAS